MPKLSKSQIRSVRKQVKEARDKALQDDENSSKSQNKELKKDAKGLTCEDRSAIRDLKSGLDKNTPRISWNYDVGDLVYLPNSSIGIIVKNNAVELPIGYFETDMIKTMKRNKYNGKVYVVTSSGNRWYHPNQLKKVGEASS